ncbi:putative secreted protein [Saccharomonospora marina XMU15]|uniref:Putative secreted protein n=1 Tax=Saccharomonospora marina XMU15 TaxID=882083 RepID=H5X443_9PSEU|nr:protease inhibitor I42 family protein [Saccharomonospora marina]EHR53314.1 putative secreted protein [Saccharomonospora marina XMU15]
MVALVRLAQSDAGRAAELRVGDTVELRLPELRTSGYRWSLRLPEGVRLVADEYVRGGGDHPETGPVGNGAPGGGGVRRLALDVVGAGRHLIEAELARPWEDRPRRSVSFVLSVTPTE